MRIGIIDKVVFAVVANTSVEELRKEHPEWKACSIKKNARPRYFKMIKETPEIGSYSQNCLKICLTGGAVWFSIYEAVEELYGKMSDGLYSKMCNATYSIPIMARKYRKMPFFDVKFQDKYAAKMEKVLKFKSDSNWTPIFGKVPLITPPCVLQPADSALWHHEPAIVTSCPSCAQLTIQ